MTLELERCAILVNPTAGGGRAERAWGRMLGAAPDLGDTRLLLPRSAEEARARLDAELERGVDAVVAIGGDGTVNLVVNRILELGLGECTACAMIPAGTGSDLARCLALSRRPAAVWHGIRHAAPRPIDAIEITTDSGQRRFAVNIASAGLSGLVGDRVNAVPQRGHLTYLLTTLGALRDYRGEPCRGLVDGEEIYDGSFFLVAVANGQYFGKGMRVAPAAVLDDGLAEVVVIPPLPLWQAPWRMPQFLTGRHVRWASVLTRRGREVRFEPHGKLPSFDVDGEVIPSGPATFRLLPGALRLLA